MLCECNAVDELSCEVSGDFNTGLIFGGFAENEVGNSNATSFFVSLSRSSYEHCKSGIVMFECHSIFRKAFAIKRCLKLKQSCVIIDFIRSDCLK